MQGCIRRERASEADLDAVRQVLGKTVAKAVGGGYCRIQMPLKPALGVRRQWLGLGWAPWRAGGGVYLPPFPMHPCPAPPPLCDADVEG